MRRLVIDLDDTITINQTETEYSDKTPNVALIQKLRDYKSAGFEIAIYTSRNMRTFSNSIGLITANTVPVIIDWLQRHDVPFDELHVGKPWCGTEGFYVDDRAIRPDEFMKMTHQEISRLLGAGDPQ